MITKRVGLNLFLINKVRINEFNPRFLYAKSTVQQMLDAVRLYQFDNTSKQKILNNFVWMNLALAATLGNNRKLIPFVNEFVEKSSTDFRKKNFITLLNYS